SDRDPVGGSVKVLEPFSATEKATTTSPFLTLKLAVVLGVMTTSHAVSTSWINTGALTAALALCRPPSQIGEYINVHIIRHNTRCRRCSAERVLCRCAT